MCHSLQTKFSSFDRGSINHVFQISTGHASCGASKKFDINVLRSWDVSQIILQQLLRLKTLHYMKNTVNLNSAPNVWNINHDFLVKPTRSTKCFVYPISNVGGTDDYHTRVGSKSIQRSKMSRSIDANPK